MPGCGLGVGQGNSGAPHDSPRLEWSQPAPPAPFSTELLSSTIVNITPNSQPGKLRPVFLLLPWVSAKPNNGLGAPSTALSLMLA